MSRGTVATISVVNVVASPREDEMPEAIGCEYLLLKTGALKFGRGGDVLLVISGPMDETGRDPFGISWDRRSVCAGENPCVDWRLLPSSVGVMAVTLPRFPGDSR